jgi:hypothetical protein
VGAVRAPSSARRLARRAPALAVAALASSLAPAAISSAARADGPVPPASCTGAAQIADVSGDGHHAATDVLSGWLTEGTGRLQAVIAVRAAAFAPEHSDAELNGSGFAMVFTVGGATVYVRTRAAPDGSLTYDYGTYANGAFTSLGATTGSAIHSAGAGTTTIDLPLTLAAGAVIGSPYVLTYDGISGGVPDWVDHAPGGVDPGDGARGADYTVGACATGGGGTGGGGAAAGGGATTMTGTTTTAVAISAPTRRAGSGKILLTGHVVPALGGVDVAVARSAHGATKTTHITTDPDGGFALAVQVTESTRLRATAGAISSGTRTVDVHSRTTVRVRHAKSGTVTLTGTVTPALPGRALLLAVGSPATTASRAVTKGRFTFRFARGHVPRGRFQVVYVPTADRAERSTSRSVRLG